MEHSTIALIVFGLCFISFVLEKIPLAVTCLLGGLVLAFSGVIEFSDVYSNLGGSIVALVIGINITAIGMQAAGVSDMVSNSLKKSGIASNEQRFLTVIFLLTALLSVLIPCSNNGVVAMFIPIIQKMSVHSNGVVKQKHGLMIAALGASGAGALTTFTTGVGILASGLVASSGILGTRAFTFFELGYSMIPAFIVMAVYFATFGYGNLKKCLAYMPDNSIDETIGAVSTEEADKVPMWKKVVALTAVIFMIVGFVSGKMNTTIVTLISASIVLVTKVAPWKRVLREIDWNTVMVLGFSSALATGLNKSGASVLIANKIVAFFGGVSASPMVLLFVCVALGGIMTQFIGNAALVIAMVPITLEVAVACNANPMCFAAATTVACIIAFSTPIGTAPMTVSLAGGYRFVDYIKIAGPINFVVMLIIAAISPLVYGL